MIHKIWLWNLKFWMKYRYSICSMWGFVQGVTRLQILFSRMFFILHLPHSFCSSFSSCAFPSLSPSSSLSFVSTSPSYSAASPPLSLFSPFPLFSPFLSSSTLCSVCTCLHACVLNCFSCVQLCSTPMDCSLLGSSVCGILQARIMEWIACPATGDLPNPAIQLTLHWQSGSLPLAPPGKPICLCKFYQLKVHWFSILNTCKSMAYSYQCMAKITNLKKKVK